MQSDTSQLADELQRLWSEFEKLIGVARAAVSEHTEDIAGQVRGGLDQVRDNLRDRARAADDYVRDNAWSFIAMAAAAGLLLGIMLPRRK